MQLIKRIFVLLFFAPVFCTGQDTIDSSKFDSSRVEVRSPSQETINTYKEKYDYSTTKVRSKSLWQRLKEWFREAFGFTSGNDEWSLVSQILKWAVIIVSIGGLLYWLFKNELSGMFTRGQGNTLHELKTQFIDLSQEESVLLAQLQKAVDTQNYKEAVRLYYALSLKKLADSSMIRFRVEKTSGNYLIELSNSAVKPYFDKLNYYFEYVFYGDFEATPSIFEKARQNYTRINELAGRRAAAR